MKYCKYCGNVIDDNAIFCSSCGARVNGDGQFFGRNPFDRFYSNNTTQAYDTRGSIFVAVISFLCWQAGLILWLVWRYTQPGKARSAAKGALSVTSMSMPVLGAALWLVWKDDPVQKDYAKVCGISAIVGVAITALAFILMIVLGTVGVDIKFDTSTFPYGDAMAMIFNLIR